MIATTGGFTLVKYTSMSMFTEFTPFYRGVFGATLMMADFCGVMPKKMLMWSYCQVLSNHLRRVLAVFFDGLFFGILN